MESSPQFALNILIVEDDFSFAIELQILLEKLGYRCAGIMENAESAEAFIKKKEPDAILMDIDLKGKITGLDLAEKLQKRNIPILFITSYKDQGTFERAKAMKMIGFLVKPLDEITLLSAIGACLRELPNNSNDENLHILKDSLLIKKGRLYHKVNLKDIIRINSDREYITIHLSLDKFIMRESLKTIIKFLSDFHFFKCHQRHIINLEYLVSINVEENMIIMSNEDKVPISRRNKKLIEEKWLGLSSN